MIGRICFVIVIVSLIAFLNFYFFIRYGDDGTDDCPMMAPIYCIANAGAIGWMMSYILVSKGLL